MMNLKKTAVAVLALGSSAVFAGTMGPVCSAVNVTVPCEATAWAFGAKALYLQPSVGVDGGMDSGDMKLGVDHQPNYNWGFQIEGAYHFNTGNDLNINWYHLSKSESMSFGQQPINGFVDVLGISEVWQVQGGTSSIDPRWDAVNFEFGQHVDFGDNKAIRFHGGAQYAHLSNSVNQNMGTLIGGSEGQGTGVSYGNTTTYNPTYNGFGPRLGMDMSYGFGNGLDIYANGATAILAGTRSFNATYEDNFIPAFRTARVAIGNSVGVSGSQMVVVPAIDAKLGATYTYAMAQGDLTLDAGWMWVNYFHVHENAYADDMDFGLQGPFIGLKWLGNVA